MTSGIYQLNFNNEAFYVGQSQNMEVRWKQHADKFRKHKAAEKMQEAYNRHGMPTAGVLIKCHKDYLDYLETYYIHQQKQYNGCLNTSAPPLDPKLNYEWLLQNKHMLEFPSVQILGNFIEIVQGKDVLQEQYDKLRGHCNTGYMQHKASVELRDGKDQNAVLLQRAQQELTRLMGRSLYDRVFNHR